MDLSKLNLHSFHKKLLILHCYITLNHLAKLYIVQLAMIGIHFYSKFGDDINVNECFFIEWLRNEQNERSAISIKDETELIQIWKDMNAIYNDSEMKHEPLISDKQCEDITKSMMKQCHKLFHQYALNYIHQCQLFLQLAR